MVEARDKHWMQYCRQKNDNKISHMDVDCTNSDSEVNACCCVQVMQTVCTLVKRAHVLCVDLRADVLHKKSRLSSRQSAEFRESLAHELWCVRIALTRQPVLLRTRIHRCAYADC